MKNTGKAEKWSDGVSAFLWFIIIISLLAMTVIGARCYKLAVNEKNKNDHIRETLSYIQSRADSSGKVTLKKSADGDMLCFSEVDGAFETRIYVYKGMLVEELSRTDAPSVPERGQEICSVQSFETEAVNENTVLITVDGKCAYIGKGEIVSE